MPELRISIAGKGLILVAVPLVFELVFVGWLNFSLEQTEIQTENELRNQAIVEQSNILLREIISISYSTVFSSLAGDSKTEEKASSENAIKETLRTIKKLIDKDSTFYFYKVETSTAQLLAHLRRVAAMPAGAIMQGISEGTSDVAETRVVLDLFDRSMQIFKQAVTRDDLAFESEDNAGSADTHGLLLSGIVLNLFVTILLALSFARNISSRLDKLAENTRRVSRNMPTLPLVGGKDEISNLDLVIHEMGNQLQAAELQRKQLTSVVRERLQEPLSNARRLLLSLQEKADSLPSLALSWVKKSSVNLERLIKLLGDLTQLQEIESGHIELNKSELKSGELIQQAIDNVQSLLGKKQIETLISGPNLVFEGDAERLTQVLINLLSNAIKFSPSAARIYISVSDLGEELEFRVKDEGPGIPGELQAKIFERYEQTNREDATKRGGAGLGLSICSIIAKSHDGKLGVDSQVSQGSAFWLHLPKQAKSGSTGETRSEIAGEGPETKLVERGSPAFKIWHKGLVVVAVPLIFQMGFLAVLSNMLDKAHAETARQMHAMQVSSVSNQVYRYAVTMVTSSAAIRISSQKEGHDYEIYNNGESGVLVGIESLFDLEKHDTTALKQVSVIFHRTERLLINTARVIIDPPGQGIAALGLVQKRAVSIQKSLDGIAGAIADLLRDQQAIKEQSPALRAKSRTEIEGLILAAVLISVLLSLILGAYFSKTISKRVNMLIENTLRFTQAQELLPPLSGNDELTAFDSDFRCMVSKIQENQEFKRHLLAVVSHELRTPLTSIYGSLTLLLEGAYGTVAEANSSTVAHAHRDILQVMDLVNDLLDLERMEAGKFPMEIKPGDLLQIASAAIDAARKAVPEANLELVCQLEQAPVHVDTDLTVKALSKLIAFIADGRSGQILIELFEAEGHFCIQVPRPLNWSGSDSEEQEFGKLQFLQSAEDNAGKGGALSLALCKTIITQMDGEMSSITSRDGGSGFFKISLAKFPSSSRVGQSLN